MKARGRIAVRFREACGGVVEEEQLIATAVKERHTVILSETRRTDRLEDLHAVCWTAPPGAEGRWCDCGEDHRLSCRDARAWR